MVMPKSQYYQQTSVTDRYKILYKNRYHFLTSFSVILVLVFTMLIPHDQRRLHMPEPWSYALAAQNFAQGNWYSFLGI